MIFSGAGVSSRVRARRLSGVSHTTASCCSSESSGQGLLGSAPVAASQVQELSRPERRERDERASRTILAGRDAPASFAPGVPYPVRCGAPGSDRSPLRGYRAEEVDAPRRAAVAVVLSGAADAPQVLFIERAEHEGDPWSGHMAFPGGRVEPDDPSLRYAAERETLEEVGLSLVGARPLGRLDDLEGRHAGRRSGLVISAHVYHVPDPGILRPNYEVQQTFWFPLADLHDPERHIDYRHPLVPDERFPGILVGEPGRHVVWGLTYRFLEVFFSVVGRPLPARWPASVRPVAEER